MAPRLFPPPSLAPPPLPRLFPFPPLGKVHKTAGRTMTRKVSLARIKTASDILRLRMGPVILGSPHALIARRGVSPCSATLQKQGERQLSRKPKEKRRCSCVRNVACDDAVAAASRCTLSAPGLLPFQEVAILSLLLFFLRRVFFLRQRKIFGVAPVTPLDTGRGLAP